MGMLALRDNLWVKFSVPRIACAQCVFLCQVIACIHSSDTQQRNSCCPNVASFFRADKKRRFVVLGTTKEFTFPDTYIIFDANQHWILITLSCRCDKAGIPLGCTIMPRNCAIETIAVKELMLYNNANSLSRGVCVGRAVTAGCGSCTSKMMLQCQGLGWGWHHNCRLLPPSTNLVCAKKEILILFIIHCQTDGAFIKTVQESKGLFVDRDIRFIGVV